MTTDPVLSALLAEHRDQIQAFVESLVSRPRKKWLTIRDACAHSGLSDPGIRRMLNSGKLTRHTPTPGRILIDVDELDSAIRASAARPRRLRLAR